MEVHVTVLVTGGLGLVGRSVVARLASEGHAIRLFDASPSRRARRLLRVLDPVRRRLEIVRGDLCNIADVGDAVRGVDAVIHLGALIPPAADRHPRYAGYVNLGGTVNLLRALELCEPAARFVYASSIAVYGDRRRTPDIDVDDAPNPGRYDHYAHQKLAAEAEVRTSGLSWSILRLTYIVSTDKLQTDPLMFHMPLDTTIETCSASDAARAFVSAVFEPAAEGRVLNIAGGPACRTTYRDYLATMLRLFGFDEPLPDDAFATGDFHCGFVNTAESQRLLHYQHDTLQDYYLAVFRAVRVKRILLRAMPVVRSMVRERLLRSSPAWMVTHGAYRIARFMRVVLETLVRHRVHAAGG